MPKRAVERVGKLSPLNMRTTPELRAALEKAARESGRSLSAEVERRVEQSFIWEASHKDAQAYFQQVRKQADELLENAKKHAAVVARKHPDTGFNDPSTEKPENAPVTADDVRKIVREMLAEFMAQQP